MRTLDQTTIRAPVERAFEAASQVERWPEILPHYRWVRFLERRESGGIVEMAAWRPFGPLRYPTWWVSEMTVDPRGREIRYRHVRGITRGMNVAWRFAPVDGGVTVTIARVARPRVAADRPARGGSRDRPRVHPRHRRAHPRGDQTIRGAYMMPLERVRNAECGMRSSKAGVRFRTPHSALRIRGGGWL